MKVTTYKGVGIHINNKGEFYCDVSNQSDKDYHATFRSPTLAKIQKAIDNLKEDFEPFEVYRLKDGQLTKVTITGRVGNRLFIGPTSLDQLRGDFFPLDVENSEQWPQILLLLDAHADQSSIIAKASAERNRIQTEIYSLFGQLPNL